MFQGAYTLCAVSILGGRHVHHAMFAISMLLCILFGLSEGLDDHAEHMSLMGVDGMWGHWKMVSKRGETGVWWRAELQPAYHVFKGAQGAVQGAAGTVGGIFNKLKR